MRGRAALGCLLASALLAGCGQGLTPRADSRTRNLLAASDVARIAVGTPERAVLSWWRDIQFANLTGFVAVLDAGAAATQAEEQALDRLSALAEPARPRIEGARRSGADLVVVRAVLEVLQPVGSAEVVTARLPFEFPMRRTAARWTIAGGLGFARGLERALRPLSGGNQG